MRSFDASFDDYVRARYGALRGLAFLLCGDRDEADDLVQTALERSHARWRHIKGDPHPYVRAAVVRTAANARRKRRPQPVPDVPERVRPDTSDDLDLRQVLLQALSLLPGDQRAVLVLKYFEDLSEADIARNLDIPAGTVKSRAARGLEALRAAGLHATLYDKEAR